jgi:osmotically-inducible protein OsmY
MVTPIKPTSGKWRLVCCSFALGAALSTAGCSIDRPTRVAVQASAADVELAATVQQALHDDPYLYDRHIEVSIERGNVVLRGFVANGVDLLSAKRIALKAAGGRHIVDDLSIKPIAEPEPGPRR